MKKRIFYANMTVQLHKRGVTWNDPEVVKKVVCSGTLEEMKISKVLKRRVLVLIMGKAKANKYELERIRIINFEVIEELGLGYLGMKKNQVNN